MTLSERGHGRDQQGHGRDQRGHGRGPDHGRLLLGLGFERTIAAKKGQPSHHMQSVLLFLERARGERRSGQTTCGLCALRGRWVTVEGKARHVVLEERGTDGHHVGQGFLGER